MRVRNITDQPLMVPALGGRVVQPDEVVEVPKDGEALVWPDVTWETLGGPADGDEEE